MRRGYEGRVLKEGGRDRREGKRDSKERRGDGEGSDGASAIEARKREEGTTYSLYLHRIRRKNTWKGLGVRRETWHVFRPRDWPGRRGRRSR